MGWGETELLNTLPPPLTAKRENLSSAAGRLALYSSRTAAGAVPLLLVHSVNAAASAYEIRSLFEYFTDSRPVYALDLPGFGNSERSDRPYTVRLMTNAILAAVAEIRKAHDCQIDAIGLSLSCEFLARAAVEVPQAFRSLGMISPTGFEGKARDEPGGTRGKEWLRRTLNFPLWGKGMFALLTSKRVIRKFLEKTWGSADIDEGLLQYDYASAHQRAARFAPYYFVSGFLFSKDILNIYQALSLPVWMVHGIRGDFVDYHLKKRVESLENWVLEILPTGAFPHFENLDITISSYRAFTSIIESQSGQSDS